MKDYTQSHNSKQYDSSIQNRIGDDMKVGERLRALMTSKELTENQLSKRSGVPQPTINRILSGESKSPRRDTISSLSRVLNCTPEWLLFGRISTSNVVESEQPHREERKYPLIDWIAAGAFTESGGVFDEDIELIGSHENPGPLGYWLEVKGRSMVGTADSPSFPPGMRILVQPEGFDVVSGKLYIAKLMDTGETTFKRYVRDAGTEYLEPLNPAFDTIRMTENVVLIGRVIDAKLPGSVF